MFTFKSSLKADGKKTGRETWHGPEIDDGVSQSEKQQYWDRYNRIHKRVVPTEQEEGFTRKPRPFTPAERKSILNDIPGLPPKAPKTPMLN